jgi:hypothetical protein
MRSQSVTAYKRVIVLVLVGKFRVQLKVAICDLKLKYWYFYIVSEGNPWVNCDPSMESNKKYSLFGA